MLHPSQSRRLDEQRETISQVGRHHHMGEALGALASHGCLQVLQDPPTHGGKQSGHWARMSLKELPMTPPLPGGVSFINVAPLQPQTQAHDHQDWEKGDTVSTHLYS